MIDSQQKKNLGKGQSFQRNTTDSLVQMQSWDQELLAQKIKANKSKLVAPSTALTSTILQKKPSTQPASTDSPKPYQDQKKHQKRKLKEIAREHDKKFRQHQLLQHPNGKSTLSSDCSDEYEVEKILDKKIENGSVFYKVKWKGTSFPQEKCPINQQRLSKGWDINSSSWEPEDNLFRVSEMIEEFEASKKYQKRSRSKNKSALSSESDLDQNQNDYKVTGEVNDEESQENIYKTPVPSNCSTFSKFTSNIVRSKLSAKNQDDQAQKRTANDDLVDKKQSQTDQGIQRLNQNQKNGKIQNSEEISKRQGYEEQNRNKPVQQQTNHANRTSSTEQEGLQRGQKQTQKQSSTLKQNQFVNPPLVSQQNNEVSQHSKQHHRQVQDSGNSKVLVQTVDSEQENDNNIQEEVNFVEGEEQVEYIFESILDKRQLEGEQVEYLLKFQNHLQPEWEYISNLENIRDEIKEFEDNLLQKQQKEADDMEEECSQNRNITSLETQVNSNKDSTQNSRQTPVGASRKFRADNHEISPEQISIDGSEEGFEPEKANHQREQQEEHLSSVKIRSKMNESKDKGLVIELPKVIQSNNEDLLIRDGELNSQHTNSTTTLNNINGLNKSIYLPVNSSMGQQIQILNGQMNNCIDNQSNGVSNIEVGCYYKGDKSYSITLVNKQNLYDLSKATFQILWKPRANNIVPLPGYVSYQMLKQVDPLALVGFYELLQTLKRDQINMI